MADGDRIIVGQANTASNPGNETSLSRNAGTARTVFVARNLNVGDGIHGEASGSSTGVQGTSASGTGVNGASDSGIGVEGHNGLANPAITLGVNAGVMGYSSSEFGVYGRSDSWMGVAGSSTSQNGVAGSSYSATGVYGSTGGVGGRAAGVEGTSFYSTGIGVVGSVGVATPPRAAASA